MPPKKKVKEDTETEETEYYEEEENIDEEPDEDIDEDVDSEEDEEEVDEEECDIEDAIDKDIASEWKTFDMRNNKGRYDDIIFEVKRKFYTLKGLDKLKKYE